MSGDHEVKERKAFDLWCKSAPEGWVLNTPSRWHAWQAGAAWARRAQALSDLAENDADLIDMEAADALRPGTEDKRS